MKQGISFSKKNYIMLAAGLIVIIVGFALMSGGGSEDPTVFNPDIFSFRRITLAPIVVIAGFVIVALGIMKKNDDQPSEGVDLDQEA